MESRGRGDVITSYENKVMHMEHWTEHLSAAQIEALWAFEKHAATMAQIALRHGSPLREALKEMDAKDEETKEEKS